MIMSQMDQINQDREEIQRIAQQLEDELGNEQANRERGVEEEPSLEDLEA